MTAAPKSPPSKRYYALAGIPLAIGVVVMIVLLVRMVGQVNDMPRVKAPGTGVMQLAQGDWVVYAEFDGAGGDSQRSNGITLRCELADASTGAPIELRTRSGTTKYNLAGLSGRSVWDVTVPSAGSYRMTCEGDAVTIAIGGGIGGAIVQIVIAMFAGGILSVVGWVVLYRRRKRALHQ